MKTEMCKEYVRSWPREVFNLGEHKHALKEELAKAGVYVLYHEGVPCYVGKGANVYLRLRAHLDFERRYGKWDSFSVFVIPEGQLRDQVEAILIASMPTANGARPKQFKRIHMPSTIKKAYLKRRG